MHCRRCDGGCIARECVYSGEREEEMKTEIKTKHRVSHLFSWGLVFAFSLRISVSTSPRQWARRKFIPPASTTHQSQPPLYYTM